MENIGLAELRGRLGISQQAAAERMDVSQGTVSKLERDEDPPITTLRTYVRRVLRGGLNVTAVLPDPSGTGTLQVPLAFGVAGRRPRPEGEETASWNGPVARYSDRDEFYDAHPMLSSGWGWRRGERSRGTAPYGSDEIFGVADGQPEGAGKWTVTIALPANSLGIYWDKREHPAMGAVVATSSETGEVLVLAPNADMRPVAQALRRLQSPSLAEVGATVERITAP